jgi:hypothetical protein
MLESATDHWVAYLRLEDLPGLSPITTVGRFATVEAAQVATDEVWAPAAYVSRGARGHTLRALARAAA